MPKFKVYFEETTERFAMVQALNRAAAEDIVESRQEVESYPETPVTVSRVVTSALAMEEDE